MKKLTTGFIIIAIIMIVLASISFADNQKRKTEIVKTQNDLARQREIWETSGMLFRYNAMKIRTRDTEEENRILRGANKVLAEDLLIAEWGKDYAYLEVRKMAFYLQTMQEIADLAGIQYPLYSIDK